MLKSLLLLFLCFMNGCANQGAKKFNVVQGIQGDVDVIIFSSTDCPIANALAPEIERIHKEVQSQGGELFLIHVLEGRTYRDANAHAEEFGLTMKVLVDSEHELVNKFNATTTPEAVVVRYNKEGLPIVVYQGLINNLFDSPGNRRDTATQHYVRDAIDAAFAQGQVSPAYRVPTGCVIEKIQ